MRSIVCSDMSSISLTDCISKHLSQCHLAQTQIKVQLPVCFKNKCQEEMPTAPHIWSKLNLMLSFSIKSFTKPWIRWYQRTHILLKNKIAENLLWARVKSGLLELSLNTNATLNYFHLPQENNHQKIPTKPFSHCTYLPSRSLRLKMHPPPSLICRSSRPVSHTSPQHHPILLLNTESMSVQTEPGPASPATPSDCHAVCLPSTYTVSSRVDMLQTFVSWCPSCVSFLYLFWKS